MHAQIRTGTYNGYAPDQVTGDAITVGRLIEKLQLALEYGEVSESDPVIVVTAGRGAVYEPVRDVITADETEEDEDDE